MDLVDQVKHGLRLGGLEATVIQIEADAFVVEDVKVMKSLEGTHSVPAGPSLAEIAADVKYIISAMQGGMP